MAQSEPMEIVQVKEGKTGKKGKGGNAPIIRPSGYVKKNGPDPKSVAESDWSRVLDAASLGIPFEVHDTCPYTFCMVKQIVARKAK